MSVPVRSLDKHQRALIGQIRVNDVIRSITNLSEMRPLQYSEQQQLNFSLERLKMLLVRLDDE